MDTITKGVDLMKTDLEKMKAQNVYCRDLLEKLEWLNTKIVHLTENLPAQFLQEFISLNEEPSPIVEHSNVAHQTPKTLSTEEEVGTVASQVGNIKLIGSEPRIQDCKKTLFGNAKDDRTMDFITKEEFSKVPKYMIGRQTLAMLNELVTAINATVEEKYSILALGRAGARKKGKLDLYMSLEREKMSGLSGGDPLYSFTAEDYERQTNTKLDKKKLNLLTVLRHCKRLKELRSGKSVQYVLIPSWERGESGNNE
ncbi:spindle and kinetochore-associated protein 1-like isoform X2 [Venturia canescens]|nr:spindle and kinetochore-associated protein 1-like isoform X2 [Venturia canescens]